MIRARPKSIDLDYFLFQRRSEEGKLQKKLKRRGLIEFLLKTIIPRVEQEFPTAVVHQPEAFGSEPCGYSIPTSDLDLMIRIDGFFLPRIAEICITTVLAALRQESKVSLISDSAHCGTVKFKYNGEKVDLRMVVLGTVQETGKIIYASSHAEEQLEQIECINCYRRRYPHLKHLMPTIVGWAKGHSLCHDGNVDMPGRITSLKSCHWAYLVCSVASNTDVNQTEIQALLATLKSLVELPLLTHELVKIRNDNSTSELAWELTWTSSPLRRDGISMLNVVHGAYCQNPAEYTPVKRVVHCLTCGLTDLQLSFSDFLTALQLSFSDFPKSTGRVSEDTLLLPPSDAEQSVTRRIELLMSDAEIRNKLGNDIRNHTWEYVSGPPDKRYFYIVRCCHCKEVLVTCIGYGADTEIKEDARRANWYVPSSQPVWKRCRCPKHSKFDDSLDVQKGRAIEV